MGESRPDKEVLRQYSKEVFRHQSYQPILLVGWQALPIAAKTIEAPTDKLFRKGFELYKSYKDKSWGLIDCISFVVMREMEITDVLTFDKHFEQAGFNALVI